eukprot:gene2876-3166_t
MSALDLEHCLEVAKKAALAAGAVIRDGGAKSNKHIEQKSSYADLVTETDKRCEDLIRSMLTEYFPEHKFIGEETAAVTGQPGELTDEPTWMVDPLDGTTNFVHSFPFSCVSIGLTVGKVPMVGVVFNPSLNELFYAADGLGAFLNGAQIRVSSTTEVGTSRTAATLTAVFDRMKSLIAAMRRRSLGRHEQAGVGSKRTSGTCSGCSTGQVHLQPGGATSTWRLLTSCSDPGSWGPQTSKADAG